MAECSDPLSEIELEQLKLLIRKLIRLAKLIESEEPGLISLINLKLICRSYFDEYLDT